MSVFNFLVVFAVESDNYFHHILLILFLIYELKVYKELHSFYPNKFWQLILEILFRHLQRTFRHLQRTFRQQDSYLKPVQIQVNIKKLKSLILRENPPTLRSITSKLRMSSVSKRKTNCKKLCETHLASEKWKCDITLDEASDCNNLKKNSIAQLTRVTVRNGLVTVR